MLKAIWNVLATSTVVTLLVGIFLLALPRVYRATATVTGSGEQMLEIQSRIFIDGVVKNSPVDFSKLVRFQELILGQQGTRDPATRLIESMTVARVGQEDAAGEDQWIGISIDAPDAELAMAVANHVAEHYLRTVYNDESILKSENEAREQLSVAESAWLEFQKQHPQVLVLVQEKERLVRLREKLLADIDILDARSRTLTAHAAQIKQADYESLVGDQLLAKSLAQLSELVLKQSELETRYGAQHSRIREINAKVSDSRQQLKEQAMLATERMKQEIQEAAKGKQALHKALLDLDESRMALGSMEVSFRALELDKLAAKRRYEAIVDETYKRHYGAAIVPMDLLGSRLTEIVGYVYLGCLVLFGVITLVRARMK